MKTLYVSDLDGTLLDKNAKISTYTKDVLNGLIQEGLLFTYATARSRTSASKAVQGLTINLPIITYNGAILYCGDDQKPLKKESFTQEEKNEIKRILSDTKLPLMVYSIIDGEEKLSWIKGNESLSIKKYLQSRGKDKRLRAVESFNQLFEGDFFYLACIDEYEKANMIYEVLKKLDLSCLMQKELYEEDMYWVEILPKFATKANAAQYVKELYQCERIVAFGDSINDLPLFEIADVSCAMMNASDEVKEKADVILFNHYEDGVVKWIQKDVAK